MADYHSDSAVIYSIVSIRIEERRLEDGCREADLVCCRVVICIHSLRTHTPFGSVHRLSLVLHHILVTESVYAADVGPV